MNWLTRTYFTEAGEVPLRTLPVAELVSAALAGDEDGRYDYASVLHLRGDRESFDTGRRLCLSPDPAPRAFGVDILAQLGAIELSPGGQIVEVPVERRAFRQPAATLVLDLAATEEADEVLRSVAHALGHLGDPRAVVPLGRWRDHPDVMIRWAVVSALTKFAGRDDTALGFLVDLTTDPEALIRDWSCFGLYLADRDSPDIRAALAARHSDDDPTTRAEALRASANLGDPQAIAPLLRLTAAPFPDPDPDTDVAYTLEEALRLLADHTGDTRVHHRLAQLRAA